ncbi:MAG: methyltransferase domain-containing protein [Chloroflexi bacterium]|nr:methyltransferase domain-containing protein [Chloroflexota bacterium]
MNPVEQFYDESTQAEWERMDRHRTEFAVTVRALSDHLPPPPATVLDIGGGPGRYSIALAERGYAVTMLDLSRANLAMAQVKAKAAGVALTAVHRANILHRADLPQQQYDAVLLMGPLYHLLERAERKTAVAHAHHLLKPGGLIFAAFITRYAPLRDMASKGRTAWIVDHAQRAQNIMTTGQNPAGEGNSFPDSYFAHPNEIRPLLENQGFETLTLMGCEGVIAGHEEHVNQLDGNLWEAWVDLNYRAGQDPVLFGASDHLLYIGRKV